VGDFGVISGRHITSGLYGEGQGDKDKIERHAHDDLTMAILNTVSMLCGQLLPGQIALLYLNAMLQESWSAVVSETDAYSRKPVSASCSAQPLL
jgi:hypothetical protein